MSRRGTVVATLAVAFVMVASVMALPLLGGGIGPFDGSEAGSDTADAADGPAVESESEAASAADRSTDGGSSGSADASGTFEPVSMEPTTDRDGSDSAAEAAAEVDADAATDADAFSSLSVQQQEAVEAGVEEGIELAQSQGVEVTQEQRAAAIEGASQSVVQHQRADVEQIQAATAGSVHGSLMQSQDLEVEQVQAAVGGATDGALAQYQTVTASQMQSATWGAAHGAVAQKQQATVEQIQVATRGAAAGACSEAGEKDVDEKPKIQEAAQGAAYGAIEQYQKLTVEQRQRTTLEHVQHAAAGASAGSLEGSTEAVLEQEQRVEVEQYQRVDIKQVQKAATGAAKGALVQKQEVTVEQTQAAARGAGKGSLKQVQSVRIEQIQRISITQIQEASFGAAKGSIHQSQEATVEQIQAAADGAAGGVLVQKQEISITQIQHAAVGASEGAVTSAVQQQVVEVEQIQAAARGAGEGAVLQKQLVDVTQVQKLATGSASGVLVQHQEATVEQIQIAARSACQETAQVVQYQRISVTQLQLVTQETASDATAYAVEQEIDADTAVELEQFLEVEASQRVEQIEEREGEATIEATDHVSDGERVVVDEVSLSEGGFVAVYEGDAVDLDPDAVIGVSEYLEAGEYAEVEIELEEPIEGERPIVVAAHHDTTGDGQFQYVESDGTEDDPYVGPSGSPVLETALVTVEEDEEEDGEPVATLEVSDQEGDGTNLTVEEANASVEYVLTAEYDGERSDSEPFAANETVSNETLELDPPLEENATVDVSVRSADDDAALANESIAYTVEEPDEAEPDEPDAEEPLATLEVSDQTGDGENLTVDEANASVEYVLAAEYDGERVDSDPIDADEEVTNETVELEPSLDENATVEVSVRSAADDAVLANDSIEYAVADDAGDDVVDDADEAEGMLAVADYEIDVGEDEPEDEYVTVRNVGNATIDLSGWTLQDRFDEGVVDSLGWEPLTFPSEFRLEPGEEVTVVTGSGDDTADTLYWGQESTVWNASGDEVAVIDADGDVALHESIGGEPEATLEVSDQTGGGENLTVDEANATDDYALTVTDEDGQQRAATGPFAADEGVSNETLELEPPLEDNATLEVAVVHADALDATGAEGDPAADEDVLENGTIEYTVEEPLPFEAEFLDCSLAAVTGSFEDGDTIGVETAFYESGVEGNVTETTEITVGEDVTAPLEGTIAFEINETVEEPTVIETDADATVALPENDFGTAITGIASPDAAAEEIDHPNPDAAACIAEVRPELPSISVVEATPVDDTLEGTTDDAIEVTFGYENPNNASLLVGSEFVEGTTDDEPVAELEPGTNEFTVEWTPESDDERLVWAIDPSDYDYDADAVEPAATATAGEIDPTDPAAFEVAITGTNAPVEQGEPLEVDAAVENVGGEDGTQAVELAVGDDVVDAADVTLEPGATETETLTADTADLEPGEYPISVSSENETAETTATVEAAGEPEFVVADLEAPATGAPGETVTVDATIENAGDLEGSQAVSYSIDGQVVAEESLALEPGGAAILSFAVTLPEGESTHAIATEDDQASVTIEAGAEPAGPEESGDAPTEDEDPFDDPEDSGGPDEGPGQGPPEDTPGRGPPDDTPGRGPPGQGALAG